MKFSKYIYTLCFAFSMAHISGSGFLKTAYASQAPVVLLNITVLRDRRGQGNTGYVNRSFLDNVAQRATERSLARVTYKVNSVSYLNNDRYYLERKEKKTLKRLSNRARSGYVNLIYSNDNTHNTARALITGHCCSKNNYNSNSNKYRYRPSIILHSRIRNTSASSVDSAAALVLHELGHHIGFHHGRGINGDNYYKTSSTIPVHVRWAQKMQSLRKPASVQPRPPSTPRGRYYPRYQPNYRGPMWHRHYRFSLQ